MDRLFNDDDTYTGDAVQIVNEVADCLTQIMSKYKENHSIREIAQIMHHAVYDVECTEILKKM